MTDAIRSHFLHFVAQLESEGHLTLKAGATGADLAPPIHDEVSPDTWIEWLLACPEVEDVFADDAQFASAFYGSHPAAPDAPWRPAGAGMVVRIYDVLREALQEALGGRKHVLLELGPPDLAVACEETAEGLFEEGCEKVLISLDPLELGETGSSALDPSEEEIVGAISLALERPLDTTTLRAALAQTEATVHLVGTDENPVVVSLDGRLEPGPIARSLRRPRRPS